jgi:nucleoside-diphosphate-sugar epimerase
MSPRNICVTAVDGQTGYLIAELLLTNPIFSKKIDSVTGLSRHPTSAKCKALIKLGAKIVTHKPNKAREMVKTLKETDCDTLCLIPPAHKDKFDITVELIEAAKKANVPNTCFLSSAGCDLADPKKQPRLREFIELEAHVLVAKGLPDTALGLSPVVIR